MEKVKTKKRYRLLKILIRAMALVVLMLFLVVLFIRSPWGQDIIVSRVVAYLSDKTETKVELENLFITFSGNVSVNGLYLEDQSGDTLIFSRELEADIPIWPILSGAGIAVNELTWTGLTAHVSRKDTLEGFNFQFLIDAFSSKIPQEQSSEKKSEPLNLTVGSVNLSEFNVSYKDDVAGIDTWLKLGEAAIDVNQLDLNEMAFEVNSIMVSNTSGSFYESKASETETTASDEALPKFSVSDLTLENVQFDYAGFDGTQAEFDLQKLAIVNPTIDLNSSNYFIDAITMNDSQVYLNLPQSNELEEQTPTTENSKDIAFEWPNVQAQLGSTDFNNNTLRYSLGNTKPTKGQFSPEAIWLEKFTLKTENVEINEQELKAVINELTFEEQSGIALNEFGLSMTATDRKLSIQNLRAGVNDSFLAGGFSADYDGLNELMALNENVLLNLDINELDLDLKQLFYFQPELKSVPELVALSKKNVTGELHVAGTLAKLVLENNRLNWGENTRLLIQGSVANVTDEKLMAYDFKELSLKTVRSDVVQFINENDFQVRLPNTIDFSSSFSGDLEQAKAIATLKTSLGSAQLDGNVNLKNGINYTGNATVNEFNLGALLMNEELGSLSMTVKSNGNGATIENLDASLKSTIISLGFRDYVIENLVLNGEITDGLGQLTSSYRDYNLNVDLEAAVDLESELPSVELKLNVIGADLMALGVTEKPIRTALVLEAKFKGYSEKFDASATVKEGVVVYENDSYLVGDLDLTAHVEPDTTSVQLVNPLVNLDLQSNADPERLVKALAEHIASYFNGDTLAYADSLVQPVNVMLKGKVSQAPILSKVFLEELKDLDTVRVMVDFKQEARELKASVIAPRVDYAGNQLDSLAFRINTTKDEFDFNLSFNKVSAGPLLIKNTTLEGVESNGEMDLNLVSYNEGEVLLNLNSRLSGSSDSLMYHIFPEELIFNSQEWIVPTSNLVVLTPNKLDFTDFELGRNSQSIEFTNKFTDIQKPHVAVLFDNFKLSDFFSYFNPDEELAKGKLKGDLVLENPFSNTGLNSDLTITDFKLLGIDLGQLELKAMSESFDRYDFNLDVTGGDVALDLRGDFLAQGTSPELDLKLNLNQFDMAVLEALAPEEVSETSGGFTGEFSLKGELRDPEYNGQIVFKDATFKAKRFNSVFALVNEELSIDNKGLKMSNFTLRDVNQNKFKLGGEVLTANALNPEFNLTLNAQNFQVLNATKEDNDFLYGTASFDVNGTVKGDLEVPVLDVVLSVNSLTDVTYVLPSASVNLEERDGVVIFVNRENPDAIITRTEEVSATLTGFDIKSLLKIDKTAKVTVIIDEETGDNFKISGEGDLKFNMNPNGQMTLAGVYEVASGSYEMNLYNVVNRKFELAPSGKISWSGDPFDAKLDISAIYRQEASSAPLMASVTSGLDPSAQNKFRQVLPFLVYLNVDGSLNAPELSFNIDMPEDKQGALGGQVYGRIQQINQNEGELNKQVFSLLVLNRFYPEPGSDGSNGGVASVARDNLNDALSDQLNTYSDKLLGETGVQLDFGLDSYTDYQGDSPEERTQLDVAAKKTLFNDRLIVSVGSEVDIQGGSTSESGAPLIGRVSIEYVLTDDGRYRLKGFRRNEFENVIDGQTVVSGMALIFSQEFNKFDELWASLFHRELEKKRKNDKEPK